MDTRTGKLYESEDAAKAAAAFESDVVPVEAELTEHGPIIRVMNGPFKGRIYAVEQGRRGRRLAHLEGKV